MRWFYCLMFLSVGCSSSSRSPTQIEYLPVSALIIASHELISETALSEDLPEDDDDYRSIAFRGAFQKQGVHLLRKNSSVPLQDLLNHTGGLKWTADPSRIFVIRRQKSGVQVFRLNQKHIQELPPTALLLFPGDEVLARSWSPFEFWNIPSSAHNLVYRF